MVGRVVSRDDLYGEIIPDEVVECDADEDVLDGVGCEFVPNEAAEVF